MMLGPDRRAGSRGTVSAEAVAAPSVTARAPRSGSRVVVVLALVWRLACGCFACPTASSELSKFLDEQPRGVTLCAAVTGNYIPWLARQSVVAGHWFLTPAVDEKIEAIRSFFAVGGPLEPKRGMLREAHVRWVYVGPLERALGDVDPRLGLERVYDADGVAIYRAP